MKISLRVVYLLILSVMTASVYAADKKDEEKAEEKPKTIAELTKDHRKLDGLIVIFQDEKSGGIKLLLNKSLLDNELVYFAQTNDGVVQTGYFRGAYLANGVIAFHRYFDRIEVVEKNTNFYFDPANALSKAASANISDAILASQTILAEDKETGDILIDGSGLFVSEALLQIKPSPNPDADPKAFKLGSLSDSKSKIVELRNYPKNTDVHVEYVYSDGAPVGETGQDITDARNVSVNVVHSFIAMPNNDFVPRFDDPRVGYFTTSITDLTSFSATPFRDLIDRWHLVKKDPSAAISEPVEPITYWIENTTPVEYRDLIKRAALEWNKSFEKAGFRNAMVIKVQPDDAKWDAGDIRYNVLRWTSSPNPPFGGYGPSFVNPRTGQILGADIMLEYSFLGRFQFIRKVLSDGGNLATHGAMLAEQFCSLGAGLAQENGFARAVASAMSRDVDALDEKLLSDSMHYLILHEIGHTLGLNHNMKATQLLNVEQVFDQQAVAELGLSGSVMDYPAVNFAPHDKPQTDFYVTSPGPYDDWAIVFGYSPDMQDQSRRDAWLARSGEAQLAFGNDADDMRSAGKGIDPRVNIYDMSSDAIEYAAMRIAQTQRALSIMPANMPTAGDSYQEFYDTYGVLMRGWARSGAVASRYIGGVYIDRTMAGQNAGAVPYTAVELEKQKSAMALLRDKMFAPEAFDSAAGTYRYLAQQRRGFNFFSVTEDPKIHDAVLMVQSTVLDHIMHPVVLKRMTDSALYGNQYSLPSMMADLTNAIFAADAKSEINSFRQNLQANYVGRLAAMTKGAGASAFDHPSRAIAAMSLQNIDRTLRQNRSKDVSTRAHVGQLRRAIEEALAVGD